MYCPGNIRIYSCHQSYIAINKLFDINFIYDVTDDCSDHSSMHSRHLPSPTTAVTTISSHRRKSSRLSQDIDVIDLEASINAAKHLSEIEYHSLHTERLSSTCQDQSQPSILNSQSSFVKLESSHNCLSLQPSKDNVHTFISETEL